MNRNCLSSTPAYHGKTEVKKQAIDSFRHNGGLLTPDNLEEQYALPLWLAEMLAWFPRARQRHALEAIVPGAGLSSAYHLVMQKLLSDSLYGLRRRVGRMVPVRTSAVNHLDRMHQQAFIYARSVHPSAGPSGEEWTEASATLFNLSREAALSDYRESDALFAASLCTPHCNPFQAVFFQRQEQAYKEFVHATLLGSLAQCPRVPPAAMLAAAQ